MKKYTMVFAFDGGQDGLINIILLKKPSNHKNPLFRGRWTVPGGHVEYGESPLRGAVREMLEETHVAIDPLKTILILRFTCNCDKTEKEHEVFVYGTTISFDDAYSAYGDEEETVDLFMCHDLPDENERLWYLQPLMELTIARMKQQVEV